MIRATGYMLALISLLLLGGFCTGCTGLLSTDAGKYFHCERKGDIRTDNIKAVGIYTFSSGPIIYAEGLEPDLYPPEITGTTLLAPDTINTEPSRELARAIKRELELRGYKAPVMSGLGHSKAVNVNNCLADARSKGMDAVFITYYAGISSRWRYARSTGRAPSLETTSTHRNGYMYLPNSALFDARTGDLLWSNSYYGLVENAHVVNISNEGFIDIVPEALIETGDENFVGAASKAVKNIFTPPLWPDSFREFPVREHVEKGG
ncbi:MAG: hypothetical protein JWQ98_2457 [Chlorobi bacterium]|nr:hypothetical protein [Chlorobiota bacterium]